MNTFKFTHYIYIYMIMIYIKYVITSNTYNYNAYIIINNTMNRCT